MDNQSFEYTYNPQQQKEVEAIRKKYVPKEEDPMEQLRALDAIPRKKAMMYAIMVGIVGALIMGLGMSLCMTELGSLLGKYALFVGILTGIFGIVLVSIAYPIYQRILKQEQERIAPEILRLTDMLMK